MSAPAENVEELRARLAAGDVPGDRLRELLEHPRAVVRSDAAESLARRKDFEPIAALLKDPEPSLRVAAVRLLAKAKDAEAGLRFVPALRHADPDVRQAAFEETLKWKGAGREKLLLVAMDDRDPRRRRAALDELRSLEAIARGLDDRALKPRAEDLLKAVTDAQLLQGLDGPESSAARTLLKGRSAAVLPVLVQRLEDEREASRAIDLLFELAPDDAPRAASRAWARMAAPARLAALERVPDLAQAASMDPDERIRRIAVRTLLRQGDWDPAWAKYLRLKIGTDGWTEADLVLVARSLPKGAEAEGMLLEAAKDGTPVLRREASQALRKREAVEALASLAETDDPWVIREVALGLGDRTDPRAVIPLLRTLRETRGARRQASERLKRYPETQAFEFALAALRHKRGSVRLWAAERLEGVDDPRAVEPLLELLDDPSAETQCAAVKALAKFAAGERVTAKLLGRLDLGDLSVRQAAIEVLGEAKATSAVPALIRLLSNTFLKAKAAAALKAIGDRKGFLAVLRRKRRDEHVSKERNRIKTMNQRRKSGETRRA